MAGHNLLQTGEAIRHTTKVYDIQVSESLTIRSPGGLLRIDGAGVTLDGVALAFRGPVSQQAVGSQRTTSTAGIPEPGEPICLSCMLKAIADGHNMIRMGGTH
ncbi:hypothetical protein D3C79_641360 [compost metagenome]